MRQVETSVDASDASRLAVLQSASSKSIRPVGKAWITPTVAIAVFVPLVIALVAGWFCRIGGQQLWDYGPVQMALHVRDYVAGKPLYPDCRNAPCMPLAYGPIVPWLAAQITRLFGANPLAPLEAGRLLAILGTIAVSVLILLLGRREGAGRPAAAICALAFVLSPLLSPLGFEFRVDMPSLAFDLSGIALFQSGFEYPAVGFFLLCYLAKQSRIAGIAAVMLYLWLNGRRGRAVGIGALYASGLILATAFLQFIYPYFWMNNYDALMALNDFSAAPRWLSILTTAELPIIALAAMRVVRTGPSRSLGLCFLIAAVSQDVLSCVHLGSNAYYFLPTLAALAIVAATELDYLLESTAQLAPIVQTALGLAIPWLVLAPILASGSVKEPGLGKSFSRFQPIAVFKESRSSSWDAIARQISGIHGIVLTDVPEVALIGNSPNVWFIDPMPVDALRRHGVFHDEPLIAALDSHKISAVVLGPELLQLRWRGRDLFWPALRDAIERNYVVIPSQGPLSIALPKARAQ